MSGPTAVFPHRRVPTVNRESKAVDVDQLAELAGDDGDPQANESLIELDVEETARTSTDTNKPRDKKTQHPSATKAEHVSTRSNQEDASQRTAPLDKAAESAQTTKRAKSSNDPANGGFKVNGQGVYYTDDDDKSHWICGPLTITALVRDSGSENWARVLEFRDLDGKRHVWVMPMELLSGRGDDVRGELMRRGLQVAAHPTARNRLLEYVSRANPKQRARRANRTGWYDDVFVLPDRTVGQGSEPVIYLGERQEHFYAQAGDLARWRDDVAAPCVGNTRLVLSISCAFASMLLSHTGAESGGIHFVGESSTGKTTALLVASSVFGPPRYLQRWSTTANGLEGLAALHSDTLLVLDELSQVDPSQAGESAYLLANGSGKQRASRTGSALARQRWRLLFLSAGEIGLVEHMRQAGKSTKAGQQVRLVEVPSDAGAGLGIFEQLHDAPSGAALSRRLNEAAAANYGSPAIAFLERITERGNLPQLPETVKQLSAQFLSDNLPSGAGGQVDRVCSRFALIAAAGELATRHGITGWPAHEAELAAAACFRDWLDQRGGSGSQESAMMLAQVKAFFEAHGDSRFTSWEGGGNTVDRAGFKRTSEFGLSYYVLPETFKKEICARYEAKAVTKALVDAGWLELEANGAPQRRVNLPGIGRTRCYVFTPAMWDA